MSPAEIKNLMEKYGIAPKKLFGQNFLISEGILNKIIKEANLSKEDTVLEVGPGLGALTFKMAPHVKKIIAVEKDRELIKILKERLVEEKVGNIEIVEQDILKFNPTGYELTANSYKLVANIPYYLTSALIRKFLESENQPQKIILMIQKEVAQRICLPRRSLGGGWRSQQIKMNILALSVQFYAEAKILFYVSKENFWPSPKVDSAIIEITPGELSASAKATADEKKLFFKIVKAGFANKRKQLAGNLARNLSLRGTKQSKLSKEKAEEILKSLGLNPKIRAEELTLEDWVKLIKSDIFYRI